MIETFEQSVVDLPEPSARCEHGEVDRFKDCKVCYPAERAQLLADMRAHDSIHVCTQSDMHPYNCITSVCVHCNLEVTDDHNPDTCVLCSGEGMLSEEFFKTSQKAHKYEDRATEIGKLVDRKQKAYGNSFGRSSGFLKELYPEGISPNQYDDFLFAARIFDKLCRIANDKDAMGESPFVDICGYALLGCVKDEERIEHDNNIPTDEPG